MGKQRIMIIEDDNDMRPLMSALLEMEGYEVICLDHIQPEVQVLSRITDQKPDLVLMDVFIKGKPSYELVEKLKQQSKGNRTKILMSSGMAVEAECLQHGADGFLLKPYMPEELILKINQILESV